MNECSHGQLARSCRICELECAVEDLTRQVRGLETQRALVVAAIKNIIQHCHLWGGEAERAATLLCRLHDSMSKIGE